MRGSLKRLPLFLEDITFVTTSIPDSQVHRNKIAFVMTKASF
jgi:hypothetical protein